MKCYALAIAALLVAASSAIADGYPAYSYDSCLASCSEPAHSWKNGCCEREPKCCDHLWDGYCPDTCCGAHLPVPIINWHSLHSNCAPYQFPCIHLPKLHWPRGSKAGCSLPPPPCAHACDSCVAAPCEASCGCHGAPLLNWLHRTLQRVPSACCGEAACDTGCSAHPTCAGNADFAGSGASAVISQPTEAAPLPPAPPVELLDQPDRPREQKNDENKPRDSKTAHAWLFPTFAS